MLEFSIVWYPKIIMSREVMNCFDPVSFDDVDDTTQATTLYKLDMTRQEADELIKSSCSNKIRRRVFEPPKQEPKSRRTKFFNKVDQTTINPVYKSSLPKYQSYFQKSLGSFANSSGIITGSSIKNHYHPLQKPVSLASLPVVNKPIISFPKTPLGGAGGQTQVIDEDSLSEGSSLHSADVEQVDDLEISDWEVEELSEEEIDEAVDKAVDKVIVHMTEKVAEYIHEKEKEKQD